MVRFKRTPSGPGDVIDRRGGSTGGMLKLGAGGGGVAIIVVLVLMILGGNSDIGGVLDQLVAPGQAPAAGTPIDPASDPDRDLVKFVGDVLADSQTMWKGIFAESGYDYTETDLVIFNGATQSGCGGAYAQSGPHYCPLDQMIYIDLDFMRQLQDRFGAAGDAAQAYIVAHEVGHHVQNLLGILKQAQTGGNDGSISLELQADCFAGVWLSTLRNGTSAAVLEHGDLAEALNAAEAVGDDNIQKEATGRVNPESWTHGSSDQRYSWLKQGFDSGQPDTCNTF